MASNVWLINGAALAGLGGGAGWSAQAGSAGGTMTDLNGLNFSFETYANYPKLCTLTVSGTCTMESTGPGQMTYNCVIPNAQLPIWGRARLQTAGYSGATGPGSIFQPSSTNPQVYHVLIRGTPAATIISITTQNTVSRVSVTTPIQCSFLFATN